ncbi:MAG: hypothetical protein D4R64_08490 [Porphyromonadaceae bacterium]|nr:MAG: hypothetical protein D4R64_08490 [Porphyromonadaceae bacterium]
MNTLTLRFPILKLIIAVFGSLLISIAGLTQITKVDVVLTGGVEDQALKKKIEINLEKLLNKINTSYEAESQKLNLSGNWFSDGFSKEIEEFWEHSHFYCKLHQINENVIFENFTGYYTIRNIPIVLNSGDTTEVKVSFLNEGIIDGFSIAIGRVQYKNSMKYTCTIDLTRKEIILNFMENMKTAYIKKDIDFIESIYSDKALIIIGKKSKIQEAGNSGDGVRLSLSQEKIEYIEMTKAEYIERLKGVFQRNSYINLSFDSFQLLKHRKYDDFYGVTLRQRWNTPTYSDVGIMFFLIQFQEDSLPKIWVRTWQDEKSVKDSSVYGFADFIIR